MIKTEVQRCMVAVTFTLDARVGAQHAVVCGEWNNWSRHVDVMDRDPDRGFSLTLELEADRTYRFRYLLDGERWENDWAADTYVPNDFGADDSVVDLRGLGGEVSRSPKRPAKSKPITLATKATPAKKSVPAKKPHQAHSPAPKKNSPAPKKKGPEDR